MLNYALIKVTVVEYAISSSFTEKSETKVILKCLFYYFFQTEL